MKIISPKGLVLFRLVCWSGIVLVFAACTPSSILPSTFVPTPVSDAFIENSPTPIQPVVSPHFDSTAIENILDDTVVLYTVKEGMTSLPLRTWPVMPALNHPALDDIYGEGRGDPSAINRYFFNFRPNLSPDKRLLLIPGIVSSPGSIEKGTWLSDLKLQNIRQISSAQILATWSPNGDHLTYIEGDTLYTMNVTMETDPQPLFHHSELWPLFARWSPDGQWIAVVTTTDNSMSESYHNISYTIWLVSFKDGSAKQLGTFSGVPIEHVASELQWSSDSNFLLARMISPPRILELQQRSILLGNINVKEWIPGKIKLLAVEQDGLRIMDSRGYEQFHINDKKVGVWAFSHDQQKLAYSEPAGNNQSNIFVFDLTRRHRILIGVLPSNSLNLLRWSFNDKALIIDDWDINSPIWVMVAEAESNSEVLLDKGLLIEVIPQSNH